MDVDWNVAAWFIGIAVVIGLAKIVRGRVTESDESSRFVLNVGMPSVAVASAEVAAGVTSPAEPKGLVAHVAGNAIIAAQRGALGPLIAQLRTIAPDDWDRRTVLVDSVANETSQVTLDQWARQDPPDPDGLVARGVGLIARAWEIRGDGLYSTVGEDQGVRFRRVLESAVITLQAATRLDPNNPAPWGHLMSCGLGLGWELDTVWELFEEAIDRNPTDWRAHNRMVTYLHEKWYGSYEQQLAFARDVASCHPGTPLCMFVVQSHLGHWEHLHNIIEDDDASAAHVSNPAVVAECERLHASAFVGQDDGQVSVLSARNVAAAWFFASRDAARTRAELAHIGRSFTDYPWHMFHRSPEIGFNKAIDWAQG